MKVISVATALLVAAPSALSFAPSAHFGVVRSKQTMLMGAAREEAISNAMEMSKAHGPTSTEAVLAWETVEEISASDNR
jgi:hypothetical protein